MQVKVKKVSPTATLPTYGSKGAACFDLYADTIKEATWGILVDTGLSFEIPEGHVMKVYSRSGHGINHGMVLRNGTGIIDSDYRGVVKVALTLQPNELISGVTLKQFITIDEIKHGDRIAQAMIVPVEQSTFIEVDELSETDRGDGGFGSTGK